MLHEEMVDEDIADKWEFRVQNENLLNTLKQLEDEKKKGAQIWLLDWLGGEAQKLTEIDGGVSDYSWSPDRIHRFIFYSPL
jgi:dipeptidyl aminopeptidase/acylaminoacyl peptidase